MSVGLCRKCRHLELLNSGNGIDEPLEPVPLCIKKDFIVESLPYDECVKECEFFECVKKGRQHYV